MNESNMKKVETVSKIVATALNLSIGIGASIIVNNAIEIPHQAKLYQRISVKLTMSLLTMAVAGVAQKQATDFLKSVTIGLGGSTDKTDDTTKDES